MALAKLRCTQTWFLGIRCEYGPSKRAIAVELGNVAKPNLR